MRSKEAGCTSPLRTLTTGRLHGSARLTRTHVCARSTELLKCRSGSVRSDKVNGLNFEPRHCRNRARRARGRPPITSHLRPSRFEIHRLIFPSRGDKLYTLFHTHLRCLLNMCAGTPTRALLKDTFTTFPHPERALGGFTPQFITLLSIWSQDLQKEKKRAACIARILSK